MKDIDFDELDRAVGSALGTDDAARSETPVASVASAIDSTPRQDASSANTDTVAVTAPSAAVKPASPARRRGQFLDMVHPSADMRSSTPLPSMIRKTISPINVDTTPEPVAEKPEEVDVPSSYGSYSEPVASEETDSSPVPEAIEDTETIQDTLVPAEQPSWPDPIEFASSATKTEDSTEESKEEASDQPFTAAESVTPATSEAEPSQTPFVTDAKVDKRPLGAFTPTDEEPEVPAVSPHAADTAQLTVSPETPTPEYSSDINSIEAAGVSMVESEDAAVTDAPEPVVQASAEKPDEAPMSVPDKSVAVTPEPAQLATNDGVAQSIPQQYKTADVKNDDDAHSLFDTKEYHQPLLPEGKKKSKKGILIVILLVILLIIGAALGYVAYTVGI